MRDPFVPRRGVPSAAEIARQLKQRAPERPSITLNPNEVAALAAYRRARQARRLRPDQFTGNDPMNQTWMPTSLDNSPRPARRVGNFWVDP